MKETDALDEYILQHIDEENDYLKALYRATHVKLLRPRMASGHLQGRMLKMFVQMIRPKQVLEIGTYSGYSALCLAEGLEDGAMLHTFEINDEQEDFTRPWLENSPYADKSRFYIGDALQVVPDMDIVFDLAFVDGNKRFYVEYYEMILQKMHSVFLMTKSIKLISLIMLFMISFMKMSSPLILILFNTLRKKLILYLMKILLKI